MTVAAVPSTHRRDMRRVRRVGTETHQRRRYAIGILPLLAVVAMLLAGAAMGGWLLSGGSLLVMETPSMCPAVCVGSLVVDRPLTGAIHVGELVTFHPPGDIGEIYTHEVFRVFPNGMIQTRGVANQNQDPWQITRSDIVGKDIFSVWGLGWVLKALPFLAIAVACWALFIPLIPRSVRRAWDRGWMTALVVVPTLFLHPLLRGVVTSTVIDPTDKHLLRTSVVNTGILSGSFEAIGSKDGTKVRSAGSGLVTSPSAHGQSILHETASLPWWGWAILVSVVVSPLAGYLWHLRRNDEVMPVVNETSTEVAKQRKAVAAGPTLPGQNSCHTTLDQVPGGIALTTTLTFTNVGTTSVCVTTLLTGTCSVTAPPDDNGYVGSDEHGLSGKIDVSVGNSTAGATDRYVFPIQAASCPAPPDANTLAGLAGQSFSLF